jgi:hypothetical protein
MTKLIWTISILLLGLVAVARSQQTSSGELSNVDKTAIIEAVLTLELPSQDSLPYPLYGKRGTISSENIEFIEPSRLSNHGFRYFPLIQIREMKRDHVVVYLRFSQVLLRDGVAVVTLSRVTEGRACFVENFYSEEVYTYTARQTAGMWIAELTHPLSFPRPSFSRKPFVRH